MFNVIQSGGSHSFIYIRSDISLSSKKSSENTSSIVWKIIEPIANNLGLDIWDIQFVKEGTQWYLRIFIDNENGVTIEDCENLSRAIDKPLDEHDPISQSYCLEVCSPGIERELKCPEHFRAFIGANVIVKTIRPIENGLREFNAILKDFNNNIISLQLEGGIDITIEKKNTVYVKLNDFEI